MCGETDFEPGHLASTSLPYQVTENIQEGQCGKKGLEKNHVTFSQQAFYVAGGTFYTMELEPVCQHLTRISRWPNQV